MAGPGERRRSRRRRAAGCLPAALAAALLAGGCAPRVGRPGPGVPDGTPPERHPFELAASVAERRASMRSLRAVVRMRYRDEREKVSVREVVAVVRPEHVRVEVLSLFGVELLVVTGGGRFAAYHRGENAAFEGAATPENLARFLRIEATVAEIADLLVGLPPRPVAPGETEIAFEPSTRLWRFRSILEGGGTQTLWLADATGLPVRSELATASGRRRYVVAWGRWEPVEGRPFPHEIALTTFEPEAHLELAYSEVERNVALAPELFVLDPPPSAGLVSLDG